MQVRHGGRIQILLFPLTATHHYMIILSPGWWYPMIFI